jgi:hypothetical protein
MTRRHYGIRYPRRALPPLVQTALVHGAATPSNTTTSAPPRPAKEPEHRRRTRTAVFHDRSWTRSTGSTPRRGHAYSGAGQGPAWSARAFVAIILAIVAITLVIWFALGG